VHLAELRDGRSSSDRREHSFVAVPEGQRFDATDAPRDVLRRERAALHCRGGDSGHERAVLLERGNVSYRKDLGRPRH
jgi:hypothetical protein